MRRVRRVLGSACAAGLALLAMDVRALPAHADPDDGTITVLVARDVDGDENYNPEVDDPQRGVSVTVTDPGGRSVSKTSDETGLAVFEPTAELSGGRYFVTAEIPTDLGLSPVPAGKTFAPMSSSVDVTSESQVVRIGVTAEPEPLSAPAPAPAPPPPEPAPVPAPEPVPAPAPAPPAAPRFAVGDLVWRDLDGDGKQEAGEPPASRTSVQLLDGTGAVLQATTTDSDGRYVFDNLAAGIYSVRFAGVPAGFKVTRSGVGGAAADSDPDITGVTPPFSLDVGQPRVRPAAAADGVRADYLNPTVDAGVAALRYAVGSVVWQDDNGDGLLEPEEPAAKARVTLLNQQGAEVRTTSTDDQGRYLFADLVPGTYRLRFSGLGPHRQLTTPRVGGNTATSSAADPATGTTDLFELSQGASGVIPAADFGEVDADFVRAALNVGTVGSYTITNRVWRDADGDGVLDPGESGVPGIKVQLLDAASEAVIASTTTDRDGRITFDRLPSGSYRLQYSGLPKGLRFTAPGLGRDRALDSDVVGGAATALITLGADRPVENQIAAGLTTSVPAASGAPPSTPPSTPAAAGSAAAEPAATPAAASSSGPGRGWPLAGGLAALAAAVCVGLAGFRWLRRRGRQLD